MISHIYNGQHTSGVSSESQGDLGQGNIPKLYWSGQDGTTAGGSGKEEEHEMQQHRKSVDDEKYEIYEIDETLPQKLRRFRELFKTRIVAKVIDRSYGDSMFDLYNRKGKQDMTFMESLAVKFYNLKLDGESLEISIYHQPFDHSSPSVYCFLDYDRHGSMKSFTSESVRGATSRVFIAKTSQEADTTRQRALNISNSINEILFGKGNTEIISNMQTNRLRELSPTQVILNKSSLYRTDISNRDNIVLVARPTKSMILLERTSTNSGEHSDQKLPDISASVGEDVCIHDLTPGELYRLIEELKKNSFIKNCDGSAKR